MPGLVCPLITQRRDVETSLHFFKSYSSNAGKRTLARRLHRAHDRAAAPALCFTSLFL